jgi:glyoxylase-like metal-dependent hydrolase (beta-lactamase superfamily II)
VIRVGAIEVAPVLDGLARIPPTAAYSGTSDADWAPHRDLLTEDGILELALGGFLVRTGDRIVLVDTGVGPIVVGPFSGGALMRSLAVLGVRPDDVTDVVFTHLHFDHVGWATQQGDITFANATYRCDVRDWEHFVVGPDGGAARKLGPVTQRLQPWDGSGGAIVAGVDARVAPGHTPGSTIIVMSSGAERALLLGDVVHCPVELLDDEWEGLYDVDPALAKRTRNALARELEGQDVPVAAAHFTGMKFGRLLQSERGRTWVT